VAVSLWAVLGLVVLLLGLALVVVFPFGAYLIGAGVAFLIVATAHWAVGRDATEPAEAEET
jgi:hypothetical protein